MLKKNEKREFLPHPQEIAKNGIFWRKLRLFSATEGVVVVDEHCVNFRIVMQYEQIVKERLSAQSVLADRVSARFVRKRRSIGCIAAIERGCVRREPRDNIQIAPYESTAQPCKFSPLHKFLRELRQKVESEPIHNFQIQF